MGSGQSWNYCHPVHILHSAYFSSTWTYHSERQFFWKAISYRQSWMYSKTNMQWILLSQEPFPKKWGKGLTFSPYFTTLAQQVRNITYTYTHWGIQRVCNFIAKRPCYEVANSLSQFPKLSTLFHRKSFIQAHRPKARKKNSWPF